MKVVITIEGKKEEVQGLVERLLDKEKEIKYVPTNPIVPNQPYSPTTPYSPTWDWNRVTCCNSYSSSSDYDDGKVTITW